MSKWLTNLMKYGGCAVFTGLMVAGYFGLRDMQGATMNDWYLEWCNAFTVPGMMLILVGALIWATNLGALTGFTYCVRFVVYSLIPGKKEERDESYGDYFARKTGNPVTGYGFLIISGLIVFAVALVFMALFYATY